MELDITHFFETASPAEYSASAAELGAHAGAITWRHALEDSAEYMLLDTEEKRDAWRDEVRGFGAWEREEIAAWSDGELNALLLQFISGDIREMRALCGDDWNASQSADTFAGRIYRGDDGRVYFCIGE